MKYLILDFNGTIIDDVQICLDVENDTIKHFNLDREPMTMDEYLHIFTFPIKGYYEKAGFTWDKYSFEEVGAYWFDGYCKRENEYKLYDGVKELLVESKQKGIKNICLSASSQIKLIDQLKQLEIYQYFDEVLGTGDIYAKSKVDIGLNWIKDKDPRECLMIGDSLHDLEVAKAMGVDCILVSKGHQAKDILIKEYDKVVDDIKEVTL